MSATISSPLTLPCGATLKNRIAKGAMTEGLGDAQNRATEAHVRLYRRWAAGGAGMLLTGNVQVDRRYMERPGNVAIDGPQSNEAIAALRNYAKAGTENDTHLWMQISHAGRQTPASVNKEPVAPSAKPLEMPGAQFGDPRAMTGAEIEDAIRRFAHVAAVARDTGFTGVQIHGAHGYLISEFLSPDVNSRTDEWGGSLENRARLLLEIVRAVRKAVGPDFPVSVKLNSADFQRGGFSHEDAIRVAAWLDAEGLDLLEISGGTYEQPRLVGLDDLTLHPEKSEPRRESTIAREAYFLEYAKDIRAAVKMPLMVTGGFRTAAGMNAALASGTMDVVGIARPLCVDTAIPAKLLSGAAAETPAYEKTLRIGPGILGPHSRFNLVKALNGWGQQGWFCLQLLRMGAGQEPDPRMGVFSAFRNYAKNEARTAAALQRP
ncbi:NADH:flavin oxidoreductase/NADH oxidase family protein [Parvibaculum sp.]|uniref:NADH:flavin oxidoreductase/NADH oxidase family protein n=1 Tax=Parvibaculum sp. TaxID=2024848 RepID=UPI001DF9B7FF|nr:NADH:flavin oxidoreductase/NADH oxidase family protein [Parvibaculum sp.]MBX3491141.1 NADH:flavin oxidoreductase/NADH oxidase family protein [Parvibaculum sp.]MCW5728961.1 NADH:flavin oxidoreductase/NADH oxidase family protein [Parvibaculum sp.]